MAAKQDYVIYYKPVDTFSPDWETSNNYRERKKKKKRTKKSKTLFQQWPVYSCYTRQLPFFLTVTILSHFPVHFFVVQSFFNQTSKRPQYTHHSHIGRQKVVINRRYEKNKHSAHVVNSTCNFLCKKYKKPKYNAAHGVFYCQYYVLRKKKKKQRECNNAF